MTDQRKDLYLIGEPRTGNPVWGVPLAAPRHGVRWALPMLYEDAVLALQNCAVEGVVLYKLIRVDESERG